MRLSEQDLTTLSADALSMLQYSDLTPDPEDRNELPPTSAAADADDAMRDLEALIGLDEVKAEIRNLAAFARVAQARTPGQGIPDLSMHMIFSGAPGTGKPTVARLLGRILCELGLLASGHVVEVDRSDLVGGYLGQTAIKTQDRVQDALGGVLFVDEAYSLSRPGDAYGQEAIDTLVQAVEAHRAQLVVVLAGYTDPMQAFLATNQGLASRFPTRLTFPDYSTEELIAIGRLMATTRGYEFDTSVETSLASLLDERRANERHFGNARAVRNLLEAAYRRQALRILEAGGPTEFETDALSQPLAVDLPEA